MMSPRVRLATEARVPAMSRPSGCPGHISSSSRFCTCSCGWSWYIFSSSRITDRSRSTSAAETLECDTMSNSTSSPRSRCSDGTRAQYAGSPLSVEALLKPGAEMLGWAPGPVGGELLVGRGIDGAANAFDRVGDLLRGRPPLGAFE